MCLIMKSFMKQVNIHIQKLTNGIVQQQTQLNLTLAPNYEIYLNESINHGEIYYFGDFELSQAVNIPTISESEYAL